AAPGDPARVDAQLVALLDVVVDEGGQCVVCGGEGVHVAGEVEVDVLHRDDLRVAATGCAAFDAHDWALRWFADGDDGVLPGGTQGVGQADQGGGLAFARRGGGHGGDENGAAQGLGPHVGAAQGGDVHLGLGGAVRDECFGGDSGALGDVRDGLEGVSLCDVDVAGLRLGDHTGISHIYRINAPPARGRNTTASAIRVPTAGSTLSRSHSPWSAWRTSPTPTP